MAESTATVSDLVARARDGDSQAWDDLVDRFLPLVFSVVSRFRLSRTDAEDVNQTVWLRLVERLDQIREPEALPGWLVTTTRNESLRVLRTRGRQEPVDPSTWGGFVDDDAGSIDDGIMLDERRQVLREGLAQISAERRELLLLLLHDPPIPYAEISERLGRPIGWIGPTRARALQELRETPAFRSMLEAESEVRRR